MSNLKLNYTKIKEITDSLFKHTDSCDVFDYFSRKNIGTQQLKKLFNIKNDIKYKKYSTGSQFNNTVTENLNSLLCFVKNGSTIYLKILNIINYFKNISKELENLVLIENCRIKEELIVNNFVYNVDDNKNDENDLKDNALTKNNDCINKKYQGLDGIIEIEGRKINYEKSIQRYEEEYKKDLLILNNNQQSHEKIL